MRKQVAEFCPEAQDYQKHNILKEPPSLFTFSCLFLLFSSTEGSISWGLVCWRFSPLFLSSELLITSRERVLAWFDRTNPELGRESSSLYGRGSCDGEKNKVVEEEEDKRVMRGCFFLSTFAATHRIRSERLWLGMSNLTSASNTEASVSSSGNRTSETTGGGGVGSSSMYPLEHQYSGSFHPPPPQGDQPPLKKKRNLPGNPGSSSSTMVSASIMENLKQIITSLDTHI